MAETEVEETVVAETPARRSRARRAAKWTLGIIGAVVLLIVAAVVVLNTPIGQRALTDRIARQTLPNGLNIRIGRIEGNLYGKAVLHDVRLSDLKGVFATIPRAEVDWNPKAWLSNRLDIHSFAARRANLLRTPTFKPGDPDKPMLPGFDISIDRLTIDNLTLAAGVAGPRAQRVDLDGEVQVTDRRLKVNSRGKFGRTDSYVIRHRCRTGWRYLRCQCGLSRRRRWPGGADAGRKIRLSRADRRRRHLEKVGRISWWSAATGRISPPSS